jgi:hypothetical protein
MPFILGIIVIILWESLGKALHGTMGENSNLIITCITFFIWGFSGVVIMAKREVPGTVSSITGTFAFLIGLIVTVFFWGLAFLGAYRMLMLLHTAQ